MTAEVQNTDRDSQFKTTALRINKMKNQHSEGEEELLKAVLRKRTNKVSTVESTASTESKKICISTQNLQSQKGEKLFKARTKRMTEKVNTNESESKSKPRKESKKMCFCSPTIHEGSFRCHLHRVSAAKNSVSEKKSSLSCNSNRTRTVEFKPQLSRFGRAASAEVITHDSLGQPSVVGSV